MTQESNERFDPERILSFLSFQQLNDVITGINTSNAAIKLQRRGEYFDKVGTVLHGKQFMWNTGIHVNYLFSKCCLQASVRFSWYHT